MISYHTYMNSLLNIIANNLISKSKFPYLIFRVIYYSPFNINMRKHFKNKFYELPVKMAE